MIRKALTILSLIGLLLSVGLWALSCLYAVVLVAEDGVFCGVVYGVAMIGDTDRVTPAGWHHGRFGVSLIRWWQFSDDDPAVRLVSLPLWIPSLLFGAWPAWLLFPVHRRRKRKKLGLCVKCGYDLRGSKERCPECGMAFQEP